ncbi:V-type ATPase subunit [Thermoclostridium stercorarium]|uniref:V-type ATPase subunit n=1 Tax=Thermoclostridium stercorarium TaxID=1510 RepID=UPI000A44C946|nr:V-type ATPase subunit [Thermoclostridium stercorarium]
MKVLLKAELSNQEIPPILVETGTYSAAEIVRIIRERDYDALFPVMREAIAEVYDVFSRTRDPQAIDLILDKALYRRFYEDLKSIENDFVKELADVIADTTNIKMFARARVLNRQITFIRNILIDGGKIDKSVYFSNSEKSVGEFINEIAGTGIGAEMLKSVKVSEKGNIQALEKALDDYIMKYIQRAKMVTIGIEPLIAFLFAKETEIKNVRIILTGKINKLPNDLIRERLRLIYV